MADIHVNSIGKEIRLRRIFDQSGFIFSLPLDHGYSAGPGLGLWDLKQTVDHVVAGGASCVIVQRGMVRTVSPALNKNTGLLVHISGSTDISPKWTSKILTGSVENALFHGADGVSLHINLSATDDHLMLHDLSQIVTDADKFALPTLAMMYVRNDEGIDSIDVNSLSLAGRVAEEAGVDVVKLKTTNTGKDYDEVMQGINIPVIIAGGNKTDQFKDFLTTISNCIQNGAKGVSIGRNVFQAKDPKKAMQEVKSTVLAAQKEV